MSLILFHLPRHQPLHINLIPQDHNRLTFRNDLNDLPPSYSMAVRQQFSNILEKSNSDTTYNFIVSAKKICPDISQKKFTKPSCNWQSIWNMTAFRITEHKAIWSFLQRSLKRISWLHPKQQQIHCFIHSGNTFIAAGDKDAAILTLFCHFSPLTNHRRLEEFW